MWRLDPRDPDPGSRIPGPGGALPSEWNISLNPSKLQIEMRAPLKKPVSETTNFTEVELLVLAFRVVEFQRSKVEKVMKQRCDWSRN